MRCASCARQTVSWRRTCGVRRRERGGRSRESRRRCGGRTRRRDGAFGWRGGARRAAGARGVRGSRPGSAPATGVDEAASRTVSGGGGEGDEGGRELESGRTRPAESEGPAQGPGEGRVALARGGAGVARLVEVDDGAEPPAAIEGHGQAGAERERCEVAVPRVVRGGVVLGVVGTGGGEHRGGGEVGVEPVEDGPGVGDGEAQSHLGRRRGAAALRAPVRPSPRATARSAPTPWHGGGNRPSPLSRGSPARLASVQAVARIGGPASKSSRPVVWLLRMDGLLKAIGVPSLE